MSGDHLLGVEPGQRPRHLRRICMRRISLLVAFPARLVAVILGVALGVLAGFFGGRVDPPSAARWTLLAFPLLLFTIALVAAMPDRRSGPPAASSASA